MTEFLEEDEDEQKYNEPVTIFVPDDDACHPVSHIRHCGRVTDVQIGKFQLFDIVQHDHDITFRHSLVNCIVAVRS